MATYIIGDIHGCYQTFKRLLKRIGFSPKADHLWFVGDLVNNGAQSKEVVRWIMDHDSRCTVVLGNHDLHMLAVWLGERPRRKKDTFMDILDDPRGDEMCEWLCARPMLHQYDDHVMVHAGLHPAWTLEDASAYARDIERALRGPGRTRLFETMYGNTPAHPDEVTNQESRARMTINVMTRMRTLHRETLALEYKFKSTLADMPEHLMPWFEAKSTRDDTHTVYFGHWSALGIHQHNHTYGLDSGCTWGGQLSAWCIERQTLTQVQAIDAPHSSPK